MHHRLTPLLIMLSSVWITPVFGWDVEKGEAAPSIYGAIPEPIKIESVHVELRGQHVKIYYEGKNTASVDFGTNLTIYTRPYQWQGYASDYPSLHFPEFEVTQLGSRLKKQTFTHAWHEGKDVATLLKSYNIDPLLVSQPEAAIPYTQLPSKHAAALIKNRIFLQRDDVVIPNWLFQQDATWPIRLFGHKNFTFVVEYDARPSSEEIETTSRSFYLLIYRYCGDPEQIKQILSSDKNTNTDAIRISEYDLPLTLGNALLPAPKLETGPASPEHESKHLATLSCGLDDQGLMGHPDLPLTEVGHKNSLRLLQITAQRK